ncbi:MAG: hypothetical protein ACK5MQ_17865 [Pikeienuella sp.]
MESIFQGMSQLGGDWRAWLVTLLVALKATHAVYCYLRCPLAHGDLTPTAEQIEAARARKYTPPARSIAIILAGMAIAVTGLHLLDDGGGYGPLGLGALVIGVFIFSTEPNRLSVMNATREVIAATGGSETRFAFTRNRLMSAQRTRATIEAGIAAVLLALMLYLYF